MKITTSTDTVEATDYYGDDGRQIGGVVPVRHGGRTVYVAFAHDWDRDSGSYDPLVADTCDDNDSAVAEIVARAGLTCRCTAEVLRSEWHTHGCPLAVSEMDGSTL